MKSIRITLIPNGTGSATLAKAVTFTNNSGNYSNYLMGYFELEASIKPGMYLTVNITN